jgi:phospholipid transport system substrate-binding protein
MRLTVLRSLMVLATVLTLTASGAPAWATPATDVVQTLNSNIIRIMQNAKQLGYKGRYKEFEPVLARVFDVPAMAQQAIGRKWGELSQAQQTKVIDTFRRYMIAQYASRFDGYNNQRFEILGERPWDRDILVRNQYVDSKGKPIAINYRVRTTGNRTQAIDVYLNEAISEVALRRSEFNSTVTNQGVDALVTQLEQRIKVVEEESIKKGG